MSPPFAVRIAQNATRLGSDSIPCWKETATYYIMNRAPYHRMKRLCEHAIAHGDAGRKMVQHWVRHWVVQQMQAAKFVEAKAAFMALNDEDTDETWTRTFQPVVYNLWAYNQAMEEIIADEGMKAFADLEEVREAILSLSEEREERGRDASGGDGDGLGIGGPSA